MESNQTAPTAVRALLKCTGLNANAYGTEVVLEAQYDHGDDTNRSFCDASPSGKLSLFVSNKDAIPFFMIGRQYFIDMTMKPVPVAAPTRQGATLFILLLMIAVLLLIVSAGAFALDATDAAAVQAIVTNVIGAGVASAPSMNPITIGLAILAAVMAPVVAIVQNHLHSKNTAAIASVAQAAIQAGQAANTQHGANLSTVANAAGQAAVSAIIPAIEGAVMKHLGGPAVATNGTGDRKGRDANSA